MYSYMEEFDMSTILTKDDLFDVANGAGFMGSGGGGPLTTGLNLVSNMPADAEVKLVTVEEVARDLLTGVVADMGAPAKMLSIKKPDSMVAAFAALRRFHKVRGQTLGYTLPVEVGGENTMVPLAVSQALDLPCVDGDGAGRAVPSLTQTTMYQYNVDPNPSYLANDADEAIGIRVRTTERVEAMARPVLADGFDQQAGLAMWTMDRPTLAKATPIRGNITVARKLGKLLRQDRVKRDPVGAVCQFFKDKCRGGILLFRGKLEDYSVQTAGGFDLGITTFRNTSGTIVRTYSQNETLMAWCSKCPAPLATAPDSICYLTKDGRPFSNADIQNSQWDLKGAEVAIIGLIADQALREADKVQASFASALKGLGYSGPYVPIEKIDQACA
jgi:DUF917 family protein